MERQLSLLEPLTTPGAVPVWHTLDEATRTQIVRRLARLIAKAAVPTAPLPDDEEHSDE